jgi:hypothetical protein
MHEEGQPAAVPLPTEALVLTCAGWPLLVFYAAAQAGLSFVVVPHRPELKLVVEPYLLLLGLILHVHWRRVTHLCQRVDMPRPVCVAVADCLSFVITFWAMAALADAFVSALG